MEKFVEQLNAAPDKGDVASRTPLHQKFTQFLKRDDTAREDNNNIRQTGQTMALREFSACDGPKPRCQENLTPARCLGKMCRILGTSLARDDKPLRRAFCVHWPFRRWRCRARRRSEEKAGRRSTRYVPFTIIVREEGGWDSDAGESASDAEMSPEQCSQ